MANKQIIVLSKTTTETEVTYSCLFWFPITTKPAPQTAGSAWAPITGATTGASAAENTAIQNGTVKEEANEFTFPVGLAVGNIEAFLQQAWTNRNNELSGIGAYQFEGSYFDGTTWGQT